MVEGGAGMDKRPLAEGGQFDPAPLPQQELDAKRLLQRGERLAQAGLGDADEIRRSGEAADFRRCCNIWPI
jgi:hypothetical protein